MRYIKRTLLILGLIVLFSIVYLYLKIIPQLDHPGGKRASTKILIGEVSKAVDQYYSDCGKYPSTEEGLAALIKKSGDCPNWGPEPYLKKLPKDPWGNILVYKLNGTKDFEIISLGADGQISGEGLAEDISSKQL